MGDGGPRIACFATQGSNSGDEQRIVDLLAPLEPEVWPFDRTDKLASAVRVLRRARRAPPDVLVMEGTGVAGGMACLASGVPFVVSSGDAVAEYLGMRSRPLGWLGARYERLLCRRCAGFVGWSPYLVGRAISFGARRAMTAAGWAAPAGQPDGEAQRHAFGIRPDDIVVGIVGSLNWTPRVRYCYGMELVRAAAQVRRDDLVVLVVGNGDGRPHLEAVAREVHGCRVVLAGAVERDAVPDALAAMDVVSLPQSLDPVGALRLTTKLSEYLGAGRPVVTGQLPLAYDLGGDWLWRIPGEAPWDTRYVDELARWLQRLDRDAISRRAACVPRGLGLFDRVRQQEAVSAFVRELAGDRRAASPTPLTRPC